MGGSFITGNFPGKFEWGGPANFNVPVHQRMPKARSQLLESHEGGAGSSLLAPNLQVISRCVLILPWTTCLVLMSFMPRPRES